MGLVQARDGYIWLATSNGLVRFDGVRFRVFDAMNTAGMGSNRYTTALLEDKQGALWAGTWDGGVTRYQNGVFQTYTIRDGLPNNTVVRVDEDSDGNIWIFTKPGLAKWSRGHLTRIAPQAGSPFNGFLVPPGHHVGDDGFLYGLWRLNAAGWQRFADGKWSPFPLPASLKHPEELNIESIFEDSQRRLWYKLRGRPAEYYCLSEGRLRSLPGLVGLTAGAFVVYQDRAGSLWLTDHQAQTALWKAGRLTRLPGFSTAQIFHILEDREGGLWIGTQDNGLYHLRRKMLHAFPHHGIVELSATLLEDHKGRIWIGSLGLAEYRQGLLTVFHPSTSARWNPNIVTALYEDAGGALWVGSREGILRFDGRQFHSGGSSLASIEAGVKAIHRDKSGALWIGTDHGLFCLRAGSLVHYTSADGLAGDAVRAILEDRKGRLWVGSNGGLAQFSEGRLAFRKQAIDCQPGGIVSLYEDSGGVIWVGTEQRGLVRIDGKNLAAYSVEQGLPDDSVQQILEDDQGFLWYGGQAGLYRLRKQELNDSAEGRISHITSTRFGKQDGLLSTDFNSLGQPSAFRARDGKLWFATMGGVAVVDPKAVPFNPVSPAALIEDCSIDRRPVACGGELTIGSRGDSLEIHYTALSFIKPEQIRFKYRLDGLDRAWVQAGTRRTAYYSHVPPGKYAFQVLAANSDGVWSTKASTMSLIVPPPFYRTWWFLALVCGAGGAILWSAWQQRVSQLRQAQIAQQAFSRQLMASQESERKRIAAELHDSLGQRLIIVKNLAAMLLLPRGSSSQPQEFAQEIVNEADQAITEVKEISYNLRPYQSSRALRPPLHPSNSSPPWMTSMVSFPKMPR